MIDIIIFNQSSMYSLNVIHGIGCICVFCLVKRNILNFNLILCFSLSTWNNTSRILICKFCNKRRLRLVVKIERYMVPSTIRYTKDWQKRRSYWRSDLQPVVPAVCATQRTSCATPKQGLYPNSFKIGDSLLFVCEWDGNWMSNIMFYYYTIFTRHHRDYHIRDVYFVRGV